MDQARELVYQSISCNCCCWGNGLCDLAYLSKVSRDFHLRFGNSEASGPHRHLFCWKISLTYFMDFVTLLPTYILSLYNFRTDLIGDCTHLPPAD
jgi:hypothetical protein